METTPCGLLKFSEVDTYNFSDAVSNFKREDELLAQLGAHESRVFDYNGVDKLTTVGAVVDPRFTPYAFRLIGKGEWFFVHMEVTVKNDIPKSGSKLVASLPSFFSAMHTQKLANVASGRGCGGWISQTGQIQLGTTSGSDSTLKAGERIQLAGWYLPKNDLKTVGVPTIGEKSPFFSNYLNSLDIVDNACKMVNTNKQVFKNDQQAIIKGNDAWLSDNSEKIFTVNSTDFSLESLKYGQYGDFSFLTIAVKTKKTITIGINGDIANARLGNVVPNRFEFEPYIGSPLENGNAGRIMYPYISSAGEISIAAIGRVGGTSNISVGIGEDIRVSGYYRNKD